MSFKVRRRKIREGRLSHMNPYQMEYLMVFMQKHTDLAKGKQSAGFSKESNNELWEIFTNEINRRGPPVRDVKAWKKVREI